MNRRPIQADLRHSRPIRSKSGESRSEFMTKLGGTLAALVSAAFIAGIAPSASAQDAAAVAPVAKPKSTLTRAYDGLWSVSISTLNGNCPSSLRYPALITNGRVGLAGGEGGYDISGAVYSSGGIVVTVSQS